MVRIGVQSEELRQQVGAVKAGTAEGNDVITRLTGQIQALASTWEGTTSADLQTPTTRPKTRCVPQQAAEQEYR